LKKGVKTGLIAALAVIAGLSVFFALRFEAKEAAGSGKEGFHGVRGSFEGFSFEEYSADGKRGYVVKAKESFVRDQKFMKVLRMGGKRENVLQSAEVTLLKDGAAAAVASAPKGVYYPVTGAVRLEEGVTVKAGDMTVSSPVVFFKREGTMELPGEYSVTTKDGSVSKGKVFRGTPEDFLKQQSKTP
jgi:hypothetical protein